MLETIDDDAVVVDVEFVVFVFVDVVVVVVVYLDNIVF